MPLPQSIDEELLRDVVLAVAVLEGQVELVVSVQHTEAFGALGPGTPRWMDRQIHGYILKYMDANDIPCNNNNHLKFSDCRKDELILTLWNIWQFSLERVEVLFWIQGETSTFL